MGRTKTGKSRRVDLSLELIAALRALRVARERQTLQRGWGEVPKSVFINGASKPLDISRVRKNLAATMKRAGVSGHILYDTRHTFPTRHLELGAPIIYVSEQLGHANAIMTLKYYAHWFAACG